MFICMSSLAFGATDSGFDSRPTTQNDRGMNSTQPLRRYGKPGYPGDTSERWPTRGRASGLLGTAHTGEQARCEQAEQPVCCAAGQSRIRLTADNPASLDRDRPYRRILQLVAAAPVVRTKTPGIVLPTLAVNDVEAVPANPRSGFQAFIATGAGERHAGRLENS